jgi:hypothetical protein
MSNKFKPILDRLFYSFRFFFVLIDRFNYLELHDVERQIPELRKKADDERAKKEAVSVFLFD